MMRLELRHLASRLYNFLLSLERKSSAAKRLLVCVYTCDEHDHLVEKFNSSIVIKYLSERVNTSILYVKADKNTSSDHISDKTLILKTEEAYRNLPQKTYAMICYCVNNLNFDYLLKIDITTFTTAIQNSMPTGGKLISEVEILDMLRDASFYTDYNGFSELSAKRKGAENWAKNKNIDVNYDKLFDSDSLPLFYSGKLWLVNKDFAAYICANGEEIKSMFTLYFPAEDVMIGYLYSKYRNLGKSIRSQ